MPDASTDLPVTTAIPPGFDDLWAPDTFAPFVKPIEVGEVLVWSDVEVKEMIAPLPRQAAVIIAYRAMKRVRVLVELRDLETEAIASGIDVSLAGKSKAAHSASHAALAAVGGADSAAHAILAVAHATDATYDTTYHATDAAYHATGPDAIRRNHLCLISLDVAQVTKLALNPPEGTPPLVAWDDPRLGPLWPDSPPEWHRKAEQEVRDLKAKLTDRRNPAEPPIPPETLSQIDNFRTLEAMAASGAFKKFKGEYVVVLDGKLVGHDANGETLLKKINEEFGELAIQAACRYVY